MSTKTATSASEKSLTIVLPVYNNEAQIAPAVTEMLELASDLTSRFAIMVVDDGSTDDTSSVAQSLALKYPQVFVHRQRQRGGLGPIVSLVRRRIKSDVVIMHDGVTPIDPIQVRRLWRQTDAQTSPTAANSRRDIRDLSSVRETHDAMAMVHGRVMGFHLVEPLTADQMASSSKPSPTPTAAPTTKRPATKPRPTDRSGVGQIPPLPRPNFMSAVAEFTLGE